MAETAASDVTDGPVLSFINKRIRALRKKYNRIVQMEEAIAQGKLINKEQEDVLRSKPAICASIDELEKLRQPLSAAVADEINLAVQHLQVSVSPSLTVAESAVTEDNDEKEKEQKTDGIEHRTNREHAVVEDLLNLLYFGSMFDVKPQSDFTSTMLTRTHERGCCLTYDYVTDDDATDLLGERDLDLISMLGCLLISRPVDSSLSHKNALQQCIEHAKLWLANSDEPIDSDSNITYAGLRGRLSKIMASDYFTTTPEMKAPVEVAAAAAAGNYASFQVPVHGSVVPVDVPVEVEGSDVEYQQKDEDTENYQENETYDNQSSPVEELHKSEFEVENSAEVPAQTEPVKSHGEMEQNQREVEPKEQHYVPRRTHQNQRGGRGGGGRRGFLNGWGGRSSGRGGGAYQNGRNQYYDQPGNYYQRNYYNNRGRGGRGAGGNSYDHHGSGVQAGHTPADS
uniref:Glycine-rich protein n=1 Tax=Davidia involucrata TaxID=16924 RepID=A0A5B6Z9Z4_DAVIN